MFQTAFQSTAFSFNAFQIASDTSSARSGYWRQFFYNLQEESLKADEKPVPEVKQDKSEKTVVAMNARKPVKKAPRKVEEVMPFEPEPLPAFRRKPVYKTVTVQDELAALPTAKNFAVFANKLENKVVQLAVQRERKQKQRRRLRRKVAALLLLAA